MPGSDFGVALILEFFAILVFLLKDLGDSMSLFKVFLIIILLGIIGDVSLFLDRVLSPVVDILDPSADLLNSHREVVDPNLFVSFCSIFIAELGYEWIA
jgi:hypothetical protein